MHIQGIIVPLLTPFKDQKIDHKSLKKLIEYVISGGINAIFILGTTGEFQNLSLSEKKDVILKTIDYTNQKNPVLVGISSQKEDEVLKLLDFSQKNGADGIVLTFLDLKTKERLLTSVHNNSKLPIILYNNPILQKNQNLEFDFIKKAVEYQNIVGIKDSSGDFNYFQKLLSLRNKAFSVYQGRTNQSIEALQNGASGLVNGYANIHPTLLKDLYKTKSDKVYKQVINIKHELENLSSNQTHSMKLELVKLKIFQSGEMKSKRKFLDMS